MFERLLEAVRLMQPSAFRIGWWTCPVCGCGLQVRLNTDEMGVRCVCCGASPVTQSIVDVIGSTCTDLPSLSVYELSSRGVLVDWLRSHAGSLTTSEYIPDVAPGLSHQGIRCEDVQRLTFADGVFDLCTSTEVFEHVVDDHAGFVQVRRVLRPGGWLIFTVPLSGAKHTVERVRVLDGRLTHLLEPEYHGEPCSRGKQVLCMRNYGTDIVERLREAGFPCVGLTRPASAMMRCARTVVVARC